MSNNQIFLTKEGLEKFKKELKELKTVKRKEIAKKIEEAIELGDLSENAEYSSVKDEQAFTEARIAELENIIRNVTIIEESKGSEQVDLGSTVIVEREGVTKKFFIVGSHEVDPVQGKISNESPLGRAFLGKRKGDIVEVEVPAGKMKFKIISVV
jgi:transcription elongation factor GreA